MQTLREHEKDASLVASHILEHLTAVSKSSTRTSPPPQSSPAQSRFDGVLLANAVLSAVLYLSAEARERKIGLMEMSLLQGKQPGYGSLALLVDSALCLASQSPPALDMGVPASCIEIAVNAATNAEIKILLDYVDSRLANFRQNPAIMRRSHHTLLRTCTTLLKRLSKSQDALLCGRVFIFLAKFLPLTEKSGLNLSGAFHTENVTPLESDLEGKVDAEGNPIDAAFYAKFWGLQKWFSNPPSALASSAWQELSTALTSVLDKFDATKVLKVTEGNGDGLMFVQPFKSRLDAPTTSVKYLTSARLLPLQLQDATFRRHILIQSLILLGWIERPFLKDWAEKAPTGDTLEEVKQLQARVLSMLEATPEHGKQFTEAVREIVLKSEFSWVVWKQAGCPEDPLHRLSPPAGFEFKQAVQTSTAGLLPASYPPPKRARTSSEAVYNIRMGTEQLDRLWNVTEDNVSMLNAEDRGGFRSVRQLLEPVIEEILEAQDNKNEDKDGDLFSAVSSDGIYSWKTLRMVARDSLPAFATTVRKGGDLSVAARELYPDELPNPVPTKSGTDQKEVTTDLLHVEQGTTDVTGGERRESADGDGDGQAADII